MDGGREMAQLHLPQQVRWDLWPDADFQPQRQVMVVCLSILDSLHPRQGSALLGGPDTLLLSSLASVSLLQRLPSPKWPAGLTLTLISSPRGRSRPPTALVPTRILPAVSKGLTRFLPLLWYPIHETGHHHYLLQEGGEDSTQSASHSAQHTVNTQIKVITMFVLYGRSQMSPTLSYPAASKDHTA